MVQFGVISKKFSWTLIITDSAVVLEVIFSVIVVGGVDGEWFETEEIFPQSSPAPVVPVCLLSQNFFKCLGATEFVISEKTIDMASN